MPNVTSMLNSESNTIDRDLALFGIKVFFALSVGIFKFRPLPSRLSTEDAVPKQMLLSPNSKISGKTVQVSKPLLCGLSLKMQLREQQD